MENKQPDNNGLKRLRDYKEYLLQRRELREKLLVKSENESDKAYLIKIRESQVYRKLMEMVKSKKVLRNEDPIWEDIEKEIYTFSPEFKSKLIFLTKGRLTELDYQTALLVKIGIRPTDTAVLFGRTKGTIVSRREYLGRKIFDENVSTKTVDRIIKVI